MRILAVLIVLMLVGACNSEGDHDGGRAGARSGPTSPPGEQIPGGVAFDLGFSARADWDDAVAQPWRVPCVEGPLPADAQRRAARGLSQDATKHDGMMWTERTFVVYPNASVARQAVQQLTTRLLSCSTASRPWRMDRVSLGDGTRRFLGLVTLARPERDAWGEPVRKEGNVVFVTRTGRTVLATSVGADAAISWPVFDLIPSLPIFAHHPATVAQLCPYADHPCGAPAAVPADDRDARLLPTRDSLRRLLPDPVPGDLLVGDAAAAPFGCRQQPLADLHVAAAVRREYTSRNTADSRLVVVAARFPDQHAARSAELQLENWMGDCRTAFDELGVTTADADHDDCRPEPLAVRRGEGLKCSWKYYDGPRAPAHSLASAVVRVANRIVLVDRVTTWRQRGRAPVEPVARAIAAQMPGASQHRPTYLGDDVVEPPVRIGSPLAQLDTIRSLDHATWHANGCLHVPLRARDVDALVDTDSGVVTGYVLGMAGMTPRGLSVYSTLQQAQDAYPVGRGSTSDDGRGDITHSWVATTPDGTEISFNTGPNYAEDGHVVGIVGVHAATANACREVFD